MQAHLRSGSRNPALRHPTYNAGSQKRRHGTRGGFFARRAGPSSGWYRSPPAPPRGEFSLPLTAPPPLRKGISPFSRNCTVSKELRSHERKRGSTRGGACGEIRTVAAARSGSLDIGG